MDGFKNFSVSLSHLYSMQIQKITKNENVPLSTAREIKPCDTVATKIDLCF